MNRMSSAFVISFLLIISAALSSCDRDHFFDFTKSTGPVVTETRMCSAFNRIVLDDDVDLILHTDTIPFLRVTAGQNIIEGILTQIKDNTLYISNANRSNWVRSFKNRYVVEAGMSQPEHMEYRGAGNITCADTIRTRDFTFDCRNGSGSVLLLLDCDATYINLHSGRCDITAKGRTGIGYYFQNDTGYILADNLVSYYCYVRNKGTGDIRLNVTNELGAEILYTGNVYYQGNPYRIDQTVTGKGRLIRE